MAGIILLECIIVFVVVESMSELLRFRLFFLDTVVSGTEDIITGIAILFWQQCSVDFVGVVYWNVVYSPLEFLLLFFGTFFFLCVLMEIKIQCAIESSKTNVLV